MIYLAEFRISLTALIFLVHIEHVVKEVVSVHHDSARYCFLLVDGAGRGLLELALDG